MHQPRPLPLVTKFLAVACGISIALAAGPTSLARADGPVDLKAGALPAPDPTSPAVRLEAAWAANPGNLAAGLALQDALEDCGKDAYAADLFSKNYEARRADPVAQFLYGKALGGDRGLTLMRQAIDLRLGLPPTESGPLGDAWRALAEAQEDEGRYADAAKSAEQLAALRSSAGNWAYLGRMRERAKDIPGAEAAYAAALKIDPHHVAAANGRALLRARAGDFAEAISLMEETVEANPKSAEARIHLGLVLSLAGKADRAKKAYAEAVPLALDDVAALVLLGATYTRLEDRSLAHQALDRALVLSPENAKALMASARLAIEERSNDMAVTLLARAAKASPKDAGVAFLQGVCAERMGNLALAVSSYQRAMRLAPQSADYAMCLAMTLEAKGDIEPALTAYKAAIDLAPKNPDLEIRLGGVYEKKKSWKLAEDAYRKALALAPKNPDPHFFLAVLYGDHMKNTQAALGELTDYKALGGKEPAALKWLDDLLAAAAK